MWTTLGVKNSRGTQSYESPHIKYQRGYLRVSSRQRGKENDFKILQTILFFLTRSALRRNYFTRTSHARVYQSLTYLGEGKHPTVTPSTHPVPPKGGGNTEKHGEVYHPGVQDHQKTMT